MQLASGLAGAPLRAAAHDSLAQPTAAISRTCVSATATPTLAVAFCATLAKARLSAAALAKACVSTPGITALATSLQPAFAGAAPAAAAKATRTGTVAAA